MEEAPLRFPASRLVLWDREPLPVTRVIAPLSPALRPKEIEVSPEAAARLRARDASQPLYWVLEKGEGEEGQGAQGGGVQEGGDTAASAAVADGLRRKRPDGRDEDDADEGDDGDDEDADYDERANESMPSKRARRYSAATEQSQTRSRSARRGGHQGDGAEE